MRRVAGPPPRGVALVNALVVVAALSAVAVALMQRAERAQQRLDDLFPADQAEMYLDAATFQVQQLLQFPVPTEDSGRPPVHLEQAWAEPVRGEPIDRGQVGWQIADLQGRFNLAWLQIEPQEEDDGQQALVTEIRAAFGRLVQDAGLTQFQLRRLEQALIPGLGQRFSAYGRATRPPPLPPFDVEELLLVQGIDEEALGRLRPVVSALPNQSAGLNMNTVSAEVLAALLPRQSPGALETRLSSVRPFEDTESAMGWVEQTAGAEAVALLQGLGADVGSDWFEARIEARIDELLLSRRVVLQAAGAEDCCMIRSVLPETEP